MHRNLFAVFASLLMSAGAASASTTTIDQKGLSLEQRVLAAQETISKMIDVKDEQAATPANEVIAYYGGYYRPWRNWNNWRNWSNYYRGY
jgi:hypothetical protein